MAFIDDIDVLNDASAAGNWTTQDYDAPQLNDTNSTFPLYLEGTSAMEWPLKKGITNGYTYTSTITGTPSITNRILVGFITYPFADIDNIPITSIQMRLSSDTGFTTNYVQWDALAQILSPENTPISGMTPVIGYEDDGTETGTFTGSAESVGWVATSGNNNDGKQGGFDWFFLISWVGVHSETRNGTYFSGLYDEYFDNGGNGLPGETSRPIGVLAQAGDFFQSNISFQLGDGTADTANIDVTETGKTIFFNNLHPNHELGYIFVNPASTNECRISLTNCVHFWNDQASTNDIFTDASNADHFKITGCSFARGGQFSLPADSANRWVRGTRFDDCQAGTISDGEFTDNIVSNGEAVTVSGDADLTGTQFLTPAVAVNTSALVWNGNFDPDGNLDNMLFTKGTNAHHAIEFGTATPTTMTLRDMEFSGFNASNNQNDSTFHVKRTTGTVTINLQNVTGNTSYRSDGATVVVQNTVTLTVTAVDAATNPIPYVKVRIENSSTGALISEGVANDQGVYTDSTYNYTTDVSVNVIVRKNSPGEIRYLGVTQPATITSSGLSVTVSMVEDTNAGVVAPAGIMRQGTTSENEAGNAVITSEIDVPTTGTSRKLLVGALYWDSATNLTVSSATYDGNGMTAIAGASAVEQEGAGNFHEIFFYRYDLPDADSGRKTISITFSANVAIKAISFAILEDVATGAVNDSGTNTGDQVTTNPSVSLNNTNDAWSIVFSMVDDTDSPSASGVATIKRSDLSVDGLKMLAVLSANRTTTGAHSLGADYGSNSKTWVAGGVTVLKN